MISTFPTFSTQTTFLHPTTLQQTKVHCGWIAAPSGTCTLLGVVVLGAAPAKMAYFMILVYRFLILK
jgi:hypothetical protein